MKAIRLHHRGGPEQLAYEKAPQPVLQHGDALVKVLASAITRNEHLPSLFAPASVTSLKRLFSSITWKNFDPSARVRLTSSCVWAFCTLIGSMGF